MICIKSSNPRYVRICIQWQCGNKPADWDSRIYNATNRESPKGQLHPCLLFQWERLLLFSLLTPASCSHRMLPTPNGPAARWRFVSTLKSRMEEIWRKGNRHSSKKIQQKKEKSKYEEHTNSEREILILTILFNVQKEEEKDEERKEKKEKGWRPGSRVAEEETWEGG